MTALQLAEFGVQYDPNIIVPHEGEKTDARFRVALNYYRRRKLNRGGARPEMRDFPYRDGKFCEPYQLICLPWQKGEERIYKMVKTQDKLTKEQGLKKVESQFFTVSEQKLQLVHSIPVEIRQHPKSQHPKMASRIEMLDFVLSTVDESMKEHLRREATANSKLDEVISLYHELS